MESGSKTNESAHGKNKKESRLKKEAASLK